MVSTSDDEHVGKTGGEGVTLGVLDGDDGEGSVVFLEVDKLSDTPGVVSLGDHNHGSHFETEDIRHLSGGDGDLDGVVHLDIRVGVTKGASIVGDSDRDLLGGDVDLLDTAELVLGLILLDTVENETSLGVVEKTEAVSRLLKLNNVHESSGVVVVCVDLSVNLDATLHADLLALLAGEGILETLAKDDGNRKTFTLLVGTGRGFGSPDSAHLAEVPMPGGIETLEVLLRSARHG